MAKELGTVSRLIGKVTMQSTKVNNYLKTYGIQAELDIKDGYWHAKWSFGRGKDRLDYDIRFNPEHPRGKGEDAGAQDVLDKYLSSRRDFLKKGLPEAGSRVIEYLKDNGIIEHVREERHGGKFTAKRATFERGEAGRELEIDPQDPKTKNMGERLINQFTERTREEMQTKLLRACYAKA